MFEVKNDEGFENDFVKLVKNILDKCKTWGAKELKVGSVAMTNEFVQFHHDGANNYRDPVTGVFKLDMTFLGVGALMLVLELGKHHELDRAYVLNLATGNTGWIDKEALTHYE